jgi:hypothetical protein
VTGHALIGKNGANIEIITDLVRYFLGSRAGGCAVTGLKNDCNTQNGNQEKAIPFAHHKKPVFHSLTIFTGFNL